MHNIKVQEAVYMQKVHSAAYMGRFWARQDDVGAE